MAWVAVVAVNDGMREGIDAGRSAAHNTDRGIRALRKVLTRRGKRQEDRAFTFGFVLGVAMVWEGVELHDFLTETRATWPVLS